MNDIWQQFWKRPASHKVPIVVTGILFLLGIVIGLTPVEDVASEPDTRPELVSAGITPTTPSPTSTVRPAPASTVQPTPTSTVIPTPTSTVIPTPTHTALPTPPRPTSTPRPSPPPTAQSGFTQAELSYMDAADRRASAVRIYLNDLNFTLGLESLYASRQDWLREIEAITEMVRFTGQMMVDLRSPSARFDASHSALTTAASSTIEAMSLLDRGLRNLSAADLDEADRLLNEANRKLDEAGRLLPRAN